jgi:hypothetical protein
VQLRMKEEEKKVSREKNELDTLRPFMKLRAQGYTNIQPSLRMN